MNKFNPKKILKEAFLRFLEKKGGELIFYNNEPEKIAIFNLIKRIKGETEFLMDNLEAHFLYATAEKALKIDGNVAEVGVYKGGSAKLICEAVHGKKEIFLFDTFEGLPEVGADDNLRDFHKGKYAAYHDEVKNYLKVYPNVHIFKGLFSENSNVIADKKFSFVNLDVDLYSSTLDCLNFFYPRMNKGGMIISHDYVDTLGNGVKKAFGEFFSDKPEVILEPLVNGSQALVVKL